MQRRANQFTGLRTNESADRKLVIRFSATETQILPQHTLILSALL